MTNNAQQNVLTELSRLETMRQSIASSTQRQFKRYPIRGEAKLVSAESTDTQQDGAVIHLRDVSRGGAGFLCDQQLDPNSCWHIIFFHQGLQIARQPIVVRHARAVNNGLFLIGSMFCADAGLLALLGADASELHAAEDVGQQNADKIGDANFLAPGEVA